MAGPWPVGQASGSTIWSDAAWQIGVRANRVRQSRFRLARSPKQSHPAQLRPPLRVSVDFVSYSFLFACLGPPFPGYLITVTADRGERLQLIVSRRWFASKIPSPKFQTPGKLQT